ncbi:MAG: hypothetical protein WKH64_07910 [Chloroflexia bacterium]
MRRKQLVGGLGVQPAARPYRPTVQDYAVCYGVATIFVVGYVAMFMIWRSALLLVYALYFDAYVVRSLYMFTVVVGGGALFVAVLASEVYLREGIARREVRRRYRRIALPLVAFCVLGLGVRVVARALL